MDDEWPQLPIDPNTGLKVLTIAPSNPLPVQQPSYGSSKDAPSQPEPVFADADTATATGPVDVETGPLAKLFGLAGNERYQTWPEKLVRSAVTAPGDALAGNISPEDEIPRALDMASLAGGGMLPMKAGEASLGAGLVRPAASDFAYHTTSVNNLESIAKNGLKPNNETTYLSNQLSSEEANKGKLWFTKFPGDYPPNKSLNNPILRFPQPDNYKSVYVSPIDPLEHFTTNTIDSNKIQIKTKNGWLPLSDHLNNPNSKLDYSTNLEKGPLFSKTLSGFLYSDTSDAAGISALHQSQTAPVFYSAVENAVKDAKLNVGTADQWLGYLKNQPGVKQEELDWTLGDLPTDGKLTKADVQAHVDANKVQVQDVNKGNAPATYNDQGYPSGTFPEGSTTKFQSYQLPGGTNYQEKLLTLPEKPNAQTFDEWLQSKGLETTGNISKNSELMRQWDSEMQAKAGDFKSSHWDEPNVLAHVRMNDRNVDGLKTLHLEEIQSDWHQKGRAEGYKITPEQKTQLESLDQKLMSGLSEADIGNPDMAAVLKTAQEKGVLTAQEAKNYADWSKGENSSIPNAPFKSTNAWTGLALKRMIRHAAENGYDAISWGNGEQQALRYQNDVRQKLDAIEWHNKTSGKVDPTGNKKLLVTPSGSGNEITLTVDKKGNVVEGHPEIKGKSLDSVLGKDIAKQVLEKDEGNIDAKGYVMNSEPMKKFYDEMLVNNANSIAKKYGGRVEEKNLNKDTSNIAIRPSGDGYKLFYPNGASKLFKTEAEAEQALQNAGKGEPIHFLKLPQGLKDTALSKGFPLFSGGFPLTPVQGNPVDQSGLDENVNVDGKTIPINNKQDVPDLAGASNNSDTVNIDKSVPRYDPKFVLKNGELGDIHKYLAIHETKEVAKMREDTAAFAEKNGRQPNAEEMHKIYLNAHYGTATPAEHAAIIADGGNPKDYEDVLHGYEKKTEHEHSGDIPADLYQKVYSHSQLRGMTLKQISGNPFK